MRQKVKTFFHIFTQSLFPQPDYYSKIPKASFNFSLKYFISLIIILNLVLVVFITVEYNPTKINRLINKITISLKTYPEDLVVNIYKGRLYTSYNRPYFFWSKQDGKQRLMLVIDETADPSKINQYNSFLLLTSNEIVIDTSNFRGKKSDTLPLTYFGNQTFDKKISQKAIQALSTLKGILLWIYLLAVPILIIFLPASSFLITFFYLLIISFIVYIIFKVYLHKKIHYKKTLQLSFHAVTLPLFLDYFLIIFRPSIQTNMKLKLFLPSPLVFIILLAIFVFSAVYEAYQTRPQKASHPINHRPGHKHTFHH